jgi:hypothetical protein
MSFHIAISTRWRDLTAWCSTFSPTNLCAGTLQREEGVVEGMLFKRARHKKEKKRGKTFMLQVIDIDYPTACMFQATVSVLFF